MTLTDYSSAIQSTMNDFGMRSINYISFMVAEGADADWKNGNLWKEVKRFTNPTPSSMNNVSFSFDVSKYVTPASGKFVSFKMLYNYVRDSDGVTNNWLHSPFRINNWYNLGLIPPNTLGSDGSWWKCTTFLFLKAPTLPQNLTISNNEKKLSKDFSVSFTSSTKGTYDLRYRLWLSVSDMNGNTIIDKVAVNQLNTTSLNYSIRNFIQDNNELKNLPQMKVKFSVRATDIYNWAYSDNITSNEITICNDTYNVFKKISSTQWEAIGVNNLKRVDKTDTSDMKIKVMDDGSEWARIFWHDVSTKAEYFIDASEAKMYPIKGFEIVGANRYSRLGDMDNYFYNGKYEFMLCYPKYSTTKYNRWTQVANPLNVKGDVSQTATTMGYQAVHIDFPTNWKYGLALSTNASSYMDCEAGHGNWFGAIGQYKAYSSGGISGFPAPTETGMASAQKEVELWVRIYRNIEITPIFTKSIIPSKGNEVYINSKSAFLQFCDDVSNGNTYEGKIVYLLTDVVTSGASEHVDFTPAGDSTHQFKGIFDGQGHTLSIQYIDGHYDYSGFIGYNAGTIKNLKVLNQYMYASKYAGAICGYNSGLIEQCYSNANIMDDDSDNTLYVGGIAGNNTGIIRKCLSITDISIPTSRAATDCGGIAGQNSGEIISCRNIGSVSGYTSGGIVGWNYVIGSSITRCTNFGTINGVWSGGIAGYTYRGFVDSCLNAGSGASAGIIGMSEYGTSNNCYYASDYNSAGMFFTDTGHTDTTNKVTLSSMKSTNMAQKLGNPFFFYDSSWNSWTSSVTKQFMKFNWEKTIGWSLNENVSNDSFGGNRTGTEVSLTVKILVDWDGTEGIADEFKLLLDGKLCRSVKKPTREMTFVLYPSDGIAANSTYTLTGNWYHYKTGFVTTKTVQADTYMGVACFEEGTMVLATDGFKPIETIREGDFVLSKNGESGKIEEQKVYHTYSHNPRNCL